MLTILSALCWLLVAFCWAVLFAPQFCGPSTFAHEFGLMADGDEFCVRLGESVGRLNMDNVLANKIFATSSSLRTEILCIFLEMRQRTLARDCNITTNLHFRRW